jgi:hypothetical protein
VRQNYLVPLPTVRDYAELNAWLRDCCLQDDQRQVNRQSQTIGAMWQAEKPCLGPLPATDFAGYISREVKLNPYGQVTFETNRYSVPADKAQKQLTLRAYPFRIEILKGSEVIASHGRCYERHQDILNPLHYLPLLAKRPGAFDHAQPMQQWRESWPPLYDELLQQLKQQQSEHKAIREFIQILQLHLDYDAALVQQAIVDALADAMPHLSGVLFCLNRLRDPAPATKPLTTLPHSQLAEVGQSPLTLPHYDQLLQQVHP